MKKKETVNVQGTEVAVLSHRQDDYISLTDMAKYKNAEIPGTVVSHWMSTVFSVNYMGLWGKMNNPDFNSRDSVRLKTNYPNRVLRFRRNKGLNSHCTDEISHRGFAS